MFVTPQNSEEVRKFLYKVIDIAIDFKMQENAFIREFSEQVGANILEPLPAKGISPEEVLEEFVHKILPYCINVASPNYMGFPYIGNSVAALGASILDAFLQQNLMNIDWSPSATFAEIAVIRWLREMIGYQNPETVHTTWEVGGIITAGGTSSNATAILLARENYYPGTLERGITDPQRYGIIVPDGITHHTLLDAQRWCGCGTNNIVFVPTHNFRMDLQALERTLIEHQGRIIAVVAYAGDSKTMTVDDLEGIAETVRRIDPRIWLHADACFGFALAASPTLGTKVHGLRLFDSVSADPHKVLNVPYPVSALLVQEPQKLQLLASQSAIAVEGKTLSFGKVTPFFATRSWMSLKLWFLIKNLGMEGISQLVERRHATAHLLAELITEDEEFLLINQVDINSVMFFYKGQLKNVDVETLNIVSHKIQQMLIKDRKYHLHRSRIKDPGIIEKGALLRPLRYMSGNVDTGRQQLVEVIEAIRSYGRNIMQ